MDRKLATIRKVASVEAHDNADRLEIAIVDGWRCIVNKEEGIKAGDLVCYIEVDSIVPDIPYFAFMKTRRFHVRTIKLRGQISQGLVVSNDKLPVVGYELYKKHHFCFVEPKEGKDLTDDLGIKKYIPVSERTPIGTSPKNHGKIHKYMTRFQWYRKLTHSKSKSFPSFIPKTDEERIQNCAWTLKDKEGIYYVTEKLDGQSSTFAWKKSWWGGDFYVCSRNVLMFELDGSNWSKMAKELNIKDTLKKIGKNIAIQGEIVGEGIQGNKYNLTGRKLFLYNVWDIDKQRYYTYNELVGFCWKYDFEKVPTLNERYTLPDTVDEMVEFSQGMSQLNASVKREGVVVRHTGKRQRLSRPQVIKDRVDYITYEDATNPSKRKSFKAINPLFLLEHDDY